MDAGVVASVDDAFATLLHHRSPYYVAKADTDAREGIALIRAAGGVPVFAHGLATTRGRIVGDEAIAAMTEAGLLGLEVDHPDHTLEQRKHLQGLADDLGLIRTGSSDYHGTNKTDRDRRLHHRARPVRGAAGGRDGQRALPRLTRNRRPPRLPLRA